MDLNTYLARGGKGHAAALAKRLGVAPALISQWRTGRRPVPLKHCPAIERATGSAVSCETLRPDVDWAYLRAHAAPVMPEPGPAWTEATANLPADARGLGCLPLEPSAELDALFTATVEDRRRAFRTGTAPEASPSGAETSGQAPQPSSDAVSSPSPVQGEESPK